MSGLDKMKAQILKEAETSAQEILSKAREESAEDHEERAGRAGGSGFEDRLKSEKDALDHVSRAASAQDMQRKQAYLAAKQEVIREILQKAYRRILDLDDREYLNLWKTAGEICASGEGRDPFTEKDLKRMPEGFSGRVKTIAAEKGGAWKSPLSPAGRKEASFSYTAAWKKTVR